MKMRQEYIRRDLADHRDAAPLAQPLVRDREDRDPLDAVMADRQALDLGRVDVVPAPDE